jgi:hypothetical protein
LAICIVLWFVYRGDVHSDRWIRGFFGIVGGS